MLPEVISSGINFVRWIDRAFLSMMAVISLSSECNADASTDVLKSLKVEGGWISATDLHRKCANTEDWAAEPPPPDITLRWDGDLLVQTGWENSTTYRVTSVKINHSFSYLFHLTLTGAGEGEEWSGISAWYVVSEGSEEQIATSIIKVEKISSVGDLSENEVKPDFTYAIAYVRCLN
jgi:hypothetical protein